MRMAAAEARRVLLEMAAREARHAGRPAHRRPTARSAPAFNRDKKTSYAELIGGTLLQRPARLEQADRQRALCPRQGASRRSTRSYKIVGKPIKRDDIAPKVFAQEDVRHRHQGAGHGACPHDPPAGRRARCRSRSTKARSRTFPAPRWCARTRASSAWSPTRSGTRSRPHETLKVSGPTPSRRSPTRPRSTTTSARRRCARREDEQAERQRRRGVQDRGARDRGRVRMAVPVACLHGTGLRGGRDQGRQASPAGPARRSRTSCATASPRTLGVPLANVDGIWVVGPGSYGRNDADDCATDCAVLAKAVGKPVRLQYIARTKAPAGTRRARPRSTGPRGDRRAAATSSPMSSSARASRASTSTPTAASRTTRWPATSSASSSSPATTSACRRSPTSSPTRRRAGRPSRRSSTAPRRCAARTCAIRSDRRSTSPASPSWTRSRRAIDQDPIEFRLKHVKDPRDRR